MSDALASLAAMPWRSLYVATPTAKPSPAERAASMRLVIALSLGVDRGRVVIPPHAVN